MLVVDIILIIIAGMFLIGSTKDPKEAWFPGVNMFASVITFLLVTIPRVIVFLVFACASDS